MNVRRAFLFCCLFAQPIIGDEFKDLIVLFLPENAVVLEAGAHVGSDTIEMAVLWPKATIYAFEPVPEIFNDLVQNTAYFPNVHRYPVALSDKSGRATFYVSSGDSDQAGSLLKPNDHLKYHPGVLFTKTIEVDCVNLDEWAQKNNVDHIDFMWLDMQGAELMVLKAAPKILRTVKMIVTEVNFYETYAGCPLYPEVKKWFESQGFIVATEVSSIYVDFGDVLFVRKI